MSLTLLIRLSDEQSWTSEPFTTTDADSLRDGCLEAFANLRTDWPTVCRAAHPAHQTQKIAQCEAMRPRSLLVQVCYHGEWCAQPWTPKIREPGAVANARQSWADEDWADAWARCVRTWKHVNELGKFLHWVAKP